LPGRYGYKDATSNSGVKRLLIWIWLDFPYDEFVLAKKAMDEAHQWAQLPQDVRDFQGIG